MVRTAAAFVCLALIALGLAGCTKCGWIWQDGGRACHSAPQPSS
jgi:hypothetical protein